MILLNISKLILIIIYLLRVRLIKREEILLKKHNSSRIKSCNLHCHQLVNWKLQRKMGIIWLKINLKTFKIKSKSKESKQ